MNLLKRIELLFLIILTFLSLTACGKSNLNDKLMAAARGKNKEAVERLIKEGADVNAKDKDNGYTVLLYVAESGNLDMVKHLVKNGADVNAKGSKRNETPLHRAARNGRKAVVA